MAIVSAKCPKCGKIFRIDPEKEAGICAACGEAFVTAKAIQEYHDTVPVGESNEADRDYAMAHLIDGIRNNPKYYVKNFNKKKYESSFYDYKLWREDTYAAMDRYLLANPTRAGELIEAFTDRFLADWAELRKERRGEANAFTDKMTLALYEVPAIYAMELNYGSDYIQTLHRKFCEKYPNNIFQPGTYEEIGGGFRNRKICFITTAICTHEGKPDDCEELTAFRGFRDGWMRENGDVDLIEEYYEIAPAIVTAIDFGDDPEARYAALRRDYLGPCYRLLQDGKMQACREKYVEMVRDLQKELFLQ